MGQKDNSCGVILVVDDQEDNRELLTAFLGFMGFIVLHACNGLEAVKVAKSECPDLIIMDLSMPVMDGFTAIRILREIPTTRTVPVVACTAHDTSSHRVQALSVGFNEFLTKPLDFTELDGMLQQYLKTA